MTFEQAFPEGLYRLDPLCPHVQDRVYSYMLARDGGADIWQRMQQHVASAGLSAVMQGAVEKAAGDGVMIFMWVLAARAARVTMESN